MSQEISTAQPTMIVYYCKKLDKIIPNPEVKKGSKYSFIDPESGLDCVYGSARSIINHFRIKEHTENGIAILEIQKQKIEKLKSGTSSEKTDEEK